MPGGAHRFSEDQFLLVKKNIIEKMNELSKFSRENLVKERNKKFLEITSNYIP